MNTRLYRDHIILLKKRKSHFIFYAHIFYANDFAGRDFLTFCLLSSFNSLR